jgi:antitoxin component YwqK of YwqJK toxin-antitoxin module
MSNPIKISRKYTTKFKKMAFGGDPDGEFLSQESHYDEKGNLVEEIKYDTDSGMPERNHYTYDEQGHLLTHQLVLEHDGVSETFIFERDAKGRLLSELKMYGDDPGDKVLYEYAAHEHPVKVEKFDADGEPESIETIRYDSKNLPLEIVKMDAQGTVVEKTTFVYLESGKPQLRATFGASGELMREMTFLYNDKGELARLTEKNDKGVITSDILTTYDERGNVVERKVRDFNSRILRFAYDDRNNCLEEDMLDEHGNLIMKNTFEFDEQNNLVSESGYYMDMNRSQNQANSIARYEYEWYETVS